MDQAVALVFLGEPFDGVVLVLVNAALEKSGDTHVKSSRSARKDVNPEFVVEAVTHGNQRIAPRQLEENALHQHGRENIVGISPLCLSRYGSFVVGRDDKVRVAFQDKAKYVLPGEAV